MGNVGRRSTVPVDEAEAALPVADDDFVVGGAPELVALEGLKVPVPVRWMGLVAQPADTTQEQRSSPP